MKWVFALLTPYDWVGFSWFYSLMHAQIIFNAMQTFELNLAFDIWLNLKDTVRQQAFQCYSGIWGVFFKKDQWPTILT